MKFIISFCLLFSSMFAAGALQNKVLNCSKIENSQLRLNCYDKLSFDLNPSEKFILKGKNLIKDCKNCHGTEWEISTNGERLVKDMNEKEILESLLAYKSKERNSAVMYFYVSNFSSEELEIMSKYIAYEVIAEAF